MPNDRKGFGRIIILDIAADRVGDQIVFRRGRHIGRPRKLTPQQLEHARKLINSGAETRAGVAALFGVDVSTLRRAMRGEG